MAKIHKNAEKFPIQWDGTVEGGEKEGDSIPSSINIKWGSGRQVPYTACWDDGNGGVDTSQCTGNLDDYFFEDFDCNKDGEINVLDVIASIASGGPTDYKNRILAIGVSGTIAAPPNGPTSTSAGLAFTWGDVAFIQEIVDGIGTGSRRARQDRLNKILDDEDKKKKLIHLICRIKGEKVYDDYTESGNIEVKVEDVELVAENIIGKVKLEIKSGV